ncbi:type II RES/Xre toxin-antitoxin system antitoxin [Compostibacter hankyongensis]|uniref:DUF2384 domain-containing protein n=1 Tax=Compostibacter hankyongensis TaxID=1007089 RepID=A0ABP8FWM9_9BACT
MTVRKKPSNGAGSPKAAPAPSSKKRSKAAAYVQDAPLLLNEPEAAYGLSPFQKIRKIKSGISKKELSSIKEKARLDYDTLAQLLSVGRATLINKKNTERFNPNVSEKILALATLYAYGYDVFGDTDAFNDWMKSPNLALGNASPLEFADTLTGIEEVRKLIGRIDYGIFS